MSRSCDPHFHYPADKITMTKEELLHELSLETFVALKPSPVHGIGVFAIRDIHRGCRNLFSRTTAGWISISFAEAEQLPPHSRNLVETYCLYDDSHYYVPDHGFSVMDISLYLNHSSDPNIISVNDGEQFEALREIKEGEELFVDYSTLAAGLEQYT